MSLSSPIITVECDECGCTDELYLTITARGWDDRDLEDQLKRLEYTVDGDDYYGDNHYCVDCARAKKKENG